MGSDGGLLHGVSVNAPYSVAEVGGRVGIAFSRLGAAAILAGAWRHKFGTVGQFWAMLANFRAHLFDLGSMPANFRRFRTDCWANSADLGPRSRREPRHRAGQNNKYARPCIALTGAPRPEGKALIEPAPAAGGELASHGLCRLSDGAGAAVGSGRRRRAATENE